MERPEIYAVDVCEDLTYVVGSDDVTAITLEAQPGVGGSYQAVIVWHGEQVHAEFPKHSCMGVYRKTEAIKARPSDDEIPF